MSNNYVTTTGAVSSLETIYTATGTAIVKFTLVGHVGKTQFTHVSLMGKRAETIGQNLKDGDAVRVVGRLEMEEWTKGDKKQSRQSIKATDVLKLSGAESRLTRLPAGSLQLEGAELRVSLVGRVGRDAETRPYGANGGALTSTSLAVEENWKDASQPTGWMSKTSWFNLQWWDNTDSGADQIKKGDMLYLEGTPTSSNRKGEDGEWKNYSGVTVTSFDCVDSLSATNGSSPARTETKSAPKPTERVLNDGQDSVPDGDDLPF